MNAVFNLSPDERRSLDNVLRSISERAHQSLSLSTLLESWERFVRRVEQGYQDSIYEYTNDLSTRDLLQEIASSVPSTLRLQLVEVLRPWDERFYAATQETSRSLFSGTKGKLEPWWFRMPKNLGQELKNDLRSERIIE